MGGFSSLTGSALGQGAAASKSSGPRALSTGAVGDFRDPLLSLYANAGVFDKPKYDGLTNSQETLGMVFHGKGLKGPLGDMYEHPEHRNDMKIHNFEKEYVPNTYKGPDYVPPEYQGGYESVLSERRSRTAPGDANVTDPATYLRDEIARSQRDEMMINQDPVVQGVRTNKKGTKTTTGRSGSKDKNYYDEYAEGTGLHT
tara:strand:+ start:1102 stop:1701 length:600 start_codon:yes stop_codon:yes gene_type:complete